MGLPAARIGDTTAHRGKIAIGDPTVLIGGRPAARLGDTHLCPPDHVTGPILPPCAFNVLIGGRPAARSGDLCVCGCTVPDRIVTGERTVLIGTSPGGSSAGMPKRAAAKSLSKRDAESKIAKQKILDDMIKHLGQDHPLMKEVETLRARGWTVRYSVEGESGTFCDRDVGEIVISKSGSMKQKAGGLAHEVGHALYQRPPGPDVRQFATKDSYVKAGLQKELEEEGFAVIHRALMARLSPDKIAGPGKKYAKIYDEFLQHGDLQRAQLEIGDEYSEEFISSQARPTTYKEFYSQGYATHWEKYHF